MKKIFRSFFLIIICCLISNVSGLEVNAAGTEQLSGVEISITSDKDEYSTGEDVNIEFTINNKTENILSELEWSLKLQDGIKLKKGSLSTKDININAWESIKVTAALEAVTTTVKTSTTTTTTKSIQSNNTDSPETGDNFSIFTPIAIILISLVIALVSKKKSKKILGIYSFMAIFAFIATSVPINAFAADKEHITANVGSSFKIASKAYTIELTVDYDIDKKSVKANEVDDADGDGLKDSEEVNNYKTNPNKTDTDDDGIDDFTEVRFGLNPNIPEKKSEGNNINLTYSPSTGNEKVQAAINISMQPDQLSSFEVKSIPSDDIYLSNEIPGYMGEGSAYEFSLDGSFAEAELTYTISDELLYDSEFIPAIYYYNEEDQFLEEQTGAVLDCNKLTLKLEHFSRYILINKKEYDKVWEYELLFEPETTVRESLDVVFVIDSSGSMSSSDPKLKRKEVVNKFIDKLTPSDRAAILIFDNYSKKLCDFTSNKDDLKKSISNLNNYGGGTNLSSGISAALNMFDYSDENKKIKSIVFLTDGSGSYSNTYTTKAKEKEVIIYTVGLGSSVQKSLLNDISVKTGGQYFSSDDAEGLYTVFDSIYELTDLMKDTDNDGLSDYHEKAMARGELCLGNGSCIAGKIDLKQMNYQLPDSDNDGLLDGEEISVVQHKNGTVYLKIKLLLPERNDDEDYNDDSKKYPYVARVINADKKQNGGGGIRVREKPFANEQSKIIGSRYTGDIVWVYDEEKDDRENIWVKIRIPKKGEDGKEYYGYGWICTEGSNSETNEKEEYIEEVTRESIRKSINHGGNHEVVLRSQAGERLTLDEYILICNTVAAEAGADSMNVDEKALVVAVIMNRVQSKNKIFVDNTNSSYTIKDVVGKKDAFQNSQEYISTNNFTDKVNQGVLDGVDKFFGDPFNYLYDSNRNKYLYFIGNGDIKDLHNYFSSEYPTSSTDEKKYYCPNCPDKPYAIVSINNGKSVPKILRYE